MCFQGSLWLIVSISGKRKRRTNPIRAWQKATWIDSISRPGTKSSMGTSCSSWRWVGLRTVDHGCSDPRHKEELLIVSTGVHEAQRSPARLRKSRSRHTGSLKLRKLRSFEIESSLTLCCAPTCQIPQIACTRLPRPLPPAPLQPKRKAWPHQAYCRGCPTVSS